jgi:hypothetical protein
VTRDDVQRWLDRYVQGWLMYDPDVIGDLFSEDAEYRYHPWDEPERGRDTIVRSWVEPDGNASARDKPGTYEAHYEPYAVDANRAVATGWSRYKHPDGSFRTLYHNAYLLEFDDDGRCRSFTEFYIEQPKPKPAAG